ncbi:MAG: TIGR04283 family arsenosugar biosynthesis glycosyltransferase [Alphaproteobacteria bacterium]
MTEAPALSVIIPTLDEAQRLPALLQALARQGARHEVIVADGGSTDGTPARALDMGARVVFAKRGRGAQLAAGAAASRGRVLLFLHADSHLPDGALAAVESALEANEHLVGGNFRLRFDGSDAFSAWLDGFYAWIRRHGVYYGDSGVFVRRGVYEALGGIRPWPLMEDYDFNRRLERAGATCCIGEPALGTSARRFEGRRPAAIVAGWLWVHALFHLGMAPDRLARIYDSARARRPHA